MSIDQFMHRQYNRSTYNCAHFVVDVINTLTGQDITTAMQGFLTPPKDRTVRQSLRRSFVRLDAPEDYAVVLMQRPKTTPHVGLYLDGRVLHIHETGVDYVDLEVATVGYPKVGFYRCLKK